MEPVVTARGVEFVYPDGRRALESVSFSIGPKESVGLIGPNGAGKTTLFCILAGLLAPAAGSVEIFGRQFDGKDDSSLRRRLGFVFQETEDQLFSPTVFDDVAFGPLNFGAARDEVRACVADALAQVGLAGFEARVPHHLSSGERRRVAIAAVLSYRPDILILDEPSSDLDPRGRNDLARLLSTTSQARLIASHDLEFILCTCDRVVLLDRGVICAEGPTAEVLCDERLLDAHGLDAPLGLRGRGADALRALAEEKRST